MCIACDIHLQKFKYIKPDQIIHHQTDAESEGTIWSLMWSIVLSV